MFKVDNKNTKMTSYRTMISLKLVCNFIEITIWHDLVLDMTLQFDMTSRVGMTWWFGMTVFILFFGGGGSSIIYVW